MAAELALPHRRRRDPFDEPGLDPEQLDEALSTDGESDPNPSRNPNPNPTRPGRWRPPLRRKHRAAR